MSINFLLKFGLIIFVAGIIAGWIISHIIRTKEKLSLKLRMFLIAVLSFIVAIGILIAFQIAWSAIWNKAFKREVRIVKDIDLDIVDEGGNLKGTIQKGSIATQSFRKSRRVYLSIPLAIDYEYIEYVKDRNKIPPDIYVKGEIVVGFEKGVPKEEAELILSKYKFDFINTKRINLGKTFFYDTGEKYIIKVPIGKEGYWIEKFQQEKTVKDARLHPDRKKTIID